jgi:hypothetical protein
MTQVFEKPSTGDIKVNIPPFPLRYNNVQKMFAYQADGFVVNEDGAGIFPDAVLVGYSSFYGTLRTTEILQDDGSKLKELKTERIYSLYWIPLPTAKNKHELIPVGSVVATSLVTKAQSNLEKYIATVQNNGKAVYEVVTAFKASAYSTSNRSSIPTLDFKDNSEAFAKDKAVTEYLAKVAVWIESDAGRQQLMQLGSQAYEGNLIPYANGQLLNAINEFNRLTGATTPPIRLIEGDAIDMDHSDDIDTSVL